LVNAHAYFLLLAHPKVSLPLPRELQSKQTIISKDDLFINAAMSLRTKHNEERLNFDDLELELGAALDLNTGQMPPKSLKFSATSDQVSIEEGAGLGSDSVFKMS